MNFYQVKKYYEDKKDFPCPITDFLMTSGYRQKQGGYISIAKRLGVKNPSQWWHLNLYCEANKDHLTRNFPYTPCGELVFWMAEASQCLSSLELEELAKEVLKEKSNRRRGNAIINEKCRKKIIEKIESAIPYIEK